MKIIFSNFPTKIELPNSFLVISPHLIIDPVTSKQKRMTEDQEDDTNMPELLGIPGIHVIQKKKARSKDSSISEEEMLEWMIEVMTNIEALRSKIPPPRRFGKRSMIVGGSWG